MSPVHDGTTGTFPRWSLWNRRRGNDIREGDAILNHEVGVGYGFEPGVIDDDTQCVPQDEAEFVGRSGQFPQRKFKGKGVLRAGGGKGTSPRTRNHRLQSAAVDGRAGGT